jgi:hypothetical protein
MNATNDEVVRLTRRIRRLRAEVIAIECIAATAIIGTWAILAPTILGTPTVIEARSFRVVSEDGRTLAVLGGSMNGREGLLHLVQDEAAEKLAGQ